MMELYLHIPYCRAKCRYCDFASYPSQDGTMAAYVDAMLAEADALRTEEPIATVFIGGGTPSILPADLLDKLLGGLHERFNIPKGIEFTSEANPGTLTKEWLDVAVRYGVNRISMGMQALQPRLLRTLGRIHDFDAVRRSVQLAKEAGIPRISTDLMFGLPGQTVADWRESLEAALGLGIDHLSCYGLIPEEGTPLKADLDSGLLTLPDEETERDMYDLALKMLAERGFAQYEISNFAKPGCECRHNIGYWQQTPYIGMGASAASMYQNTEGMLRTANPPKIADYLRMVQSADWTMRETTHVSPEDARFETLMLGLRMTGGVSESAFAAMHGLSLMDYCGETLQSQQKRGLLVRENGYWRLSRRGMDVQNAILVEILEAAE